MAEWCKLKKWISRNRNPDTAVDGVSSTLTKEASKSFQPQLPVSALLHKLPVDKSTNEVEQHFACSETGLRMSESVRYRSAEPNRRKYTGWPWFGEEVSFHFLDRYKGRELYFICFFSAQQKSICMVSVGRRMGEQHPILKLWKKTPTAG